MMPAVYLISSYTNAGAVSLFNIMFPIMALAFISPLKIKKLRLPGIIAAGALIVAEAGMIASALYSKKQQGGKSHPVFCCTPKTTRWASGSKEASADGEK